MRIILIISFASIIACNYSKQSKPDVDSTVAQRDTVIKLNAADGKPNDTTIHINFPAGANSVTVNGEMKDIDHPVTVYIPITVGKELTALLSTQDSLANIRFSHIYTPDGKSDGPFGRELKRKITQQGTYKLLISENQMQGDEWKGALAVTVSVK